MDFDTLGLIMTIGDVALRVAVAVASFRRSRNLSRYSIWYSALVALIAQLFWLIWLIVWWVHRKRIAIQWDQVRAARAGVSVSEDFVA